MHDSDDFLPNRLNFDVVVFSGCTMKEMQILVLVTLMFSIGVLGGLTKCLISMFLIGVGLSFPATFGLTWFTARLFQKLKQGKPKGYVKQAFLLWCENQGLLKTPYIRRSGVWSIGRKL